MSTKLFNCHGKNLLNHLKQKNIEFQVEQYTYRSQEDFSKQNEIQVFKNKNPNDKKFNSSLGVIEEKVNLLQNKDYIYYANFEDENMTSGYYHKEQDKLAKLPLWRTVLKFKEEEVYALGKTKKESLKNAVYQLETEIKSSL